MSIETTLYVIIPHVKRGGKSIIPKSNSFFDFLSEREKRQPSPFGVLYENVGNALIYLRARRSANPSYPTLSQLSLPLRAVRIDFSNAGYDKYSEINWNFGVLNNSGDFSAYIRRLGKGDFGYAHYLQYSDHEILYVGGLRISHKSGLPVPTENDLSLGDDIQMIPGSKVRDVSNRDGSLIISGSNEERDFCLADAPLVCTPPQLADYFNALMMLTEDLLTGKTFPLIYDI